ncbi:MAG: DUF4435 domain-containing protein [Planctomycetaceae bacterium]|nr:DUF4435 domain-containing protein [Planctomycetaceae bacterium]
MNVTGRGTKLLFCEGEPDSLDYRLLSRLLRGKPPTILVVPSGGKQGLRSFIRGRLAGYQSPPPYLAFRDRDFDVEPSADVLLIAPHQGKPLFHTHRAAIENYLLDADLIDNYWTTLAQNAPNWSHGTSPGVSDIRQWMNEAARQIASYEAIRWALSRLKPGDRWPEISTTWTEGSGCLPSSLAENDCIARAKSLLADYQRVTSSISESHFVELYRHFSSRFAALEFIERAEYLVWFHGKDLAKAMQRLHPNSISMQHFCSWAVEHVDWRQHADLRELAERV